MIETTFVIIKPDAIARGLVGEIITRFERKGYTIARIARRWKNKFWCQRHYSHVPESIYKNNESFMTSMPIIGFILTGEQAIITVRQIVGCTNSLAAAPGTIRGDYGQDASCRNLIHASDSKQKVEFESELFFDPNFDIDNE